MRILHDKEVLEMVRGAKSGDGEQLENLINYYTPAIKSRCSKYNINGFDFDDTFSEGVRTLLKCVRSYNFGSTPFGAYFFRALVNELNYILRKSYKSADIAKRMYSPKERIDEGEDVEDKLLGKETKKELREYISSLTDVEKKVVSEVYFNRKTMAEVSREMNLKFSKVQHIRNMALNKMRKQMVV